MNRVCSLHNEYCPDGRCRWCEPVAAEPEGEIVFRSGWIPVPRKGYCAPVVIPAGAFVAVMPRPEQPDRAVTLQIGPFSTGPSSLTVTRDPGQPHGDECPCGACRG